MFLQKFDPLTILVNGRQQSREGSQTLPQIRVPQIVAVTGVSSEGAVGVAAAAVVALRLDDRPQLLLAEEAAHVHGLQGVHEVVG